MLTKTNRKGVFFRESQIGVITYVITYRVNGKLYKKKVGTNQDGWTVDKAYLEKVNREVNKIEPIEPEYVTSQSTLNDVAEFYFKSIEQKSDYSNTKSRYVNHIKKDLGSKEISEISVQHILQLKSKLSKKVSTKTKELLAEKTINGIIDLISTIYSYYNKINYKTQVDNPARKDLVERYKLNNARQRFLSKSEYELLLEYVANRNEHTTRKNTSAFRTQEMLLYIKLLITTGMRTYSALTLKAKDIDIEQGTMKVHNHKSNRVYTAYIHSSIMQELKILHESLPSDYYIFGQKDEPYHRSTINKRLLPILNKLFNKNVADRRDKVVVHSLRHTFGSWLAQKGTSLYIICKLMDHADISQTQVYSKLAPDTGKDLVSDILS